MLEESNHSLLDFSSSHDNPINTVVDMTAVVIYNWVVWAILAQIVCVFGVINNIINIICFVKQGFNESINVSLTGLAISDLGCLLPLVWTNLSYTPAFSDLDFPFDLSEIQFMTSAMVHVTFTRISSWMTATITLERCLCVAMPLKVKEIATPRRMTIIVTTVFVVLLAAAIPQFYYYKAGKKYFPERNKTLIGIIFSKELIEFEKFSYPLNVAFVQFLAFVIIIVCTFVLVIELNIKANWRKKSAKSTIASRLTRSNMKVSKMVVMISTLFIVCFVTIIISAIVFTVVPDFTLTGKFRHLLTVIGGMGFLTESINSSSNIFIYYRMSSRFREVFREMFSKIKVTKSKARIIQRN